MSTEPTPLNIVVIGGGPGGYTAAIRAAQKGAEVTLIEMDRLGGTCLNRGCIPSKCMKSSAQILEDLKKAGTFGVTVEGTVSLDMAALMERKQKVVDNLGLGIQTLLAHNRVQVIRGRALIDAQGRLWAAMGDGTRSEVPWDRLIIAAGTGPMNIPAFPFDGRDILSSDDILNLDTLPESILILGGGVIGCEFACILSALGAKVTLVEAQDRILPVPFIEKETVKLLAREMKKRKIKVITGQAAVSATPEEGGVRVLLKGCDRPDTTEILAEKMAVCVGRTSNAPALGLENLGLTLDRSGWIPVDNFMASAVPGIYAIGDITGPERIMLAHVAASEAEVAVDHIFGMDRPMDYGAIPGAIFTLPEMANVGLTMDQALEKGIDARTDAVMFRTLGKSQVIGEIAGESRIVSDRQSGRILGVHIIGPHASDLIAEGVLAVKEGISVAALSQTIHAHPTLSEIMLETAFKACDNPLHG